MSHEMVERIAAKIEPLILGDSVACIGKDLQPDVLNPEQTAIFKEHYRSMAKAILDELRDPTDDMVEAGKRAMDRFDAQDQVMGAALGDARAVKMKLRWQAMIDWCLK